MIARPEAEKEKGRKKGRERKKGEEGGGFKPTRLLASSLLNRSDATGCCNI